MKKVSVCMITYNQEKFVAQAINSVLMQKTSFDYELIIGDDNSIDTTLSIIQDFKNKYPEKITLLQSKNNTGPVNNFLRTLKSCQGQYIAILEGDDYWTSENKLQEQTDFLESNLDFMICFTSTEAINNTSSKINYLIPPEKYQNRISSIVDLLQCNYIATCSIMYRNHILSEIPGWIATLKMGDYPLSILIAQYGFIGFIDKIMARYRMHDKSYYSSNKPIENYFSIIAIYETVMQNINKKYSTIIQKMIIRYRLLVIYEYLNECKIDTAKIYIKKHFSFLEKFTNIYIHNFIYTFLLVYLPGLNSLRLLIKKQ